MSIEIFLLIVNISSEKQISLLNKDSPKLWIAKLIFEKISIKKDKRKYEKFIHIPQSINFIRKLCGCSTFEYVKWEIKYFIEKYNKIPKSNELAINKIPLEVDVPKIFSKFLSFKIFEFIKVISSKTEYKLLSIELNKFPKIVLIVSIIIWVIFVSFNY